MKLLFRSLTIWLVLIAAEILHGILRTILLVPWVGQFRSNQIGVFTGSIIILAIASPSIGWIGTRQTRTLLLIGLLWLVLTTAFEVLFGRLIVKLSWDRILADYNVAEGGLMPLGLVVLLFSPWIAARLRITDLRGGSPGEGSGKWNAT